MKKKFKKKFKMALGILYKTGALQAQVMLKVQHGLHAGHADVFGVEVELEAHASVRVHGQHEAHVAGEGDAHARVGEEAQRARVEHGAVHDFGQERVREAEEHDVGRGLRVLQVHVELALEAPLSGVLVEVRRLRRDVERVRRGGEVQRGREREAGVGGVVGADGLRVPLHVYLEDEVAGEGGDVDVEVNVDVVLERGGVVHGELLLEQRVLHARGHAGEDGAVERAAAADRAAHVVVAEVHGERTRVEGVPARELRGVVRLVFEPERADAVDVDLGDGDVEHVARLVRATVAQEHRDVVVRLAAPVHGGHAGRARVLNMVCAGVAQSWRSAEVSGGVLTAPSGIVRMCI